jgi:carbohydrate-selective porin OprB
MVRYYPVPDGPIISLHLTTCGVAPTPTQYMANHYILSLSIILVFKKREESYIGLCVSEERHTQRQRQRQRPIQFVSQVRTKVLIYGQLYDRLVVLLLI